MSEKISGIQIEPQAFVAEGLNGETDEFKAQMVESTLHEVEKRAIAHFVFIVLAQEIHRGGSAGNSEETMISALQMFGKQSYGLEDGFLSNFKEIDNFSALPSFNKSEIELEKERDIASGNGNIDLTLSTQAKLDYFKDSRDFVLETLLNIAKGVEGGDFKATVEHMMRVPDIAMEFAQYLKTVGMSEVEIIEEDGGLSFSTASLLHDIGKIGVEPAILYLPRKLSDEEFSRYIKPHPIIGCQILRRLGMPEAAEIVLHHHEQYNGKGYPDGLKGDDIPFLAQIVSIADMFDALVHKRSYKEEWSLSNTIEEIEKGSDSKFNPELVNWFIQFVKKHELSKEGQESL